MADVTTHDHGRTGKVFYDCGSGDTYATVTKPDATSETFLSVDGATLPRVFQWLRDQGLAISQNEETQLSVNIAAQCSTA